MNRPWQVSVVFGLCLALLLGAMGWVSWTALKLDVAHRRRAAFEEDVRLALWRMDSRLAPLIARENSRPYFAWYALYPAERAYASMFANRQQNEMLVPSPLLTEESPHVLLHFQIEPTGQVTSPQVPQADVYLDPNRVEDARHRLAELIPDLDQQVLLASLPRETPQPAPALAMVDNAYRGDPSRGGGKGDIVVQSRINAAEYQARSQTINEAVQAAQQMSMPQMAAVRGQDPTRGGATTRPMVQQPLSPQGTLGDQVTVGTMTPLWVGQRLVLARHVSVAGRSYVQGCWLDWNGIEKWLLEGVADLLPAATLQPVHGDPSDQRERTLLAALPVRLVPARMPIGQAGGPTPIRLSLLLAWTCVLLAALAVAMLLTGTLTLSERRATFVSSVTHELRTPLTTLRMYTEMLAGGMVPDQARQRQYLDTLQREAERLSHLVENVLSYARLERGQARKRVETVNLHRMIDRAGERLASRCDQGSMRLAVHLPAWSDKACVRVDVSAVEQILFNLVDNACKYAAAAANRCVELSVDTDGEWAFVRVRDHGPGISAKDARRLFKPFSKSARDAANSAPGVGLGLALSRRLARQMRGDLRMEKGLTEGAGFLLRLPLAQCCQECEEDSTDQEV